MCAPVAASRDANLADLHLQQVAIEDRVFVDSETGVTDASVALVMNAGTDTDCRIAATHAVGV